MTATTPLADELRAMIADAGPIPVERYMALCLQHPVHGYYIGRDSIGRDGDFVTAPEISQMFGELLGLWCAQAWIDQGAPAPFSLVELGPGRGTLMADALRATRSIPGFSEAAQITLVETSPRLRAIQRDTLGKDGERCTWLSSVEQLDKRPAFILANEFFDALPACQYVRAADGWYERCVGLTADDALVFTRAGEPIAIAASAARDGAIVEIGRIAMTVMASLADRIQGNGGALLICDYGHAESGTGDTLQAVRAHAFADALSAPGLCDLTTHVDFAALRTVARAGGTAVHGPVLQSLLLERLGIRQRAAALRRRATPSQATDIEAALTRLLDPQSSMARLFRAMAVLPTGAPTPPGFEDGE